MCGRFAVVDDWPGLMTRFLFDLSGDGPKLPAPNVSPTQGVLAVRADADGSRVGSVFRWGLVPFWAKDLSIGQKMINARSETVATKPAFRNAFKQRRCLIPASGFYEWARDGGKRQPYFFRRRDGEPYAFAGIWDRWTSAQGEEVETVSILTTEANEVVGSVHPRMPVILLPEAEDTWLSPAAPAELLLELARPYPVELMQGYPVTAAVNTPRYQGLDATQPLSV